MNHIHEPDPQFLEKLEWQLATEGRRRQRFNSRTEPTPNWRNLKMLSIIAFSVLTGFVASSTAAYIEEMSQRQLLLTKQEIQIRLSESQLRLMEQHHEDVKRRIDAGVTSTVEGNRVSTDLNRLEIELQRLRLDRKEIQISSQSPQNDLSAPLIGGRDFVTERLQLELLSMREIETQLATDFADMQRRVDAGVISSRDLDSLRLQLDQVVVALEDLNRKIELRFDFQNGKISAEQVHILGMMTEAEKRLETALAVVTVLQDRLTGMEKAYQDGLVSQPDVAQARFQLEVAEADGQLAQIELQSLRITINN